MSILLIAEQPNMDQATYGAMLEQLTPLMPALSRSARCRLIRSTSYFVGSIFG
jgi:hypothetical protein